MEKNHLITLVTERGELPDAATAERATKDDEPLLSMAAGGTTR